MGVGSYNTLLLWRHRSLSNYDSITHHQQSHLQIQQEIQPFNSSSTCQRAMHIPPPTQNTIFIHRHHFNSMLLSHLRCTSVHYINTRASQHCEHHHSSTGFRPDHNQVNKIVKHHALQAVTSLHPSEEPAANSTTITSPRSPPLKPPPKCSPFPQHYSMHWPPPPHYHP